MTSSIGALAGPVVRLQPSICPQTSQCTSRSHSASKAQQPQSLQALRNGCRTKPGARAGSGDGDAAPVSEMSAEKACSLLDVSPEAGFEEVLQAKKRLTADLPPDSQTVSEIEAAYDVLLMASMKRRLSGEVSTSVRFADVAKTRLQTQAQRNVPRSVLGGVVSVQTPSKSDLTNPSLVFAALAGWSLLQGFTQPAGSLDANAPALQLGLSGMASFYFLKTDRKVTTGRAIGLAFAGALIGSIIGGGLNSWLRVDIVPIAGLSSPSVFVSEFAILSLWATCVFLS